MAPPLAEPSEEIFDWLVVRPAALKYGEIVYRPLALLFKQLLQSWIGLEVEARIIGSWGHIFSLRIPAVAQRLS